MNVDITAVLIAAAVPAVLCFALFLADRWYGWHMSIWLCFVVGSLACGGVGGLIYAIISSQWTFIVQAECVFLPIFLATGSVLFVLFDHEIKGVEMKRLEAEVTRLSVELSRREGTR